MSVAGKILDLMSICLFRKSKQRRWEEFLASDFSRLLGQIDNAIYHLFNAADGITEKNSHTYQSALKYTNIILDSMDYYVNKEKKKIFKGER